MIKHFFCDLDGTIFFDGVTKEADLEAVRKFVADGGQFHVATGRSDQEIITFSKQFDIPVTHRVSGNGSTVYSVSGENLAMHNLDDEILTFLGEHLIEHQHRITNFELQVDDKVHFHDEPSPFARELKDGILVIDPDLFSKIGTELHGAKFYIDGETEMMVELAAELRARFANKVEIFDDGHFLNVNPKDIHKGVGITALLDAYDIAADEIAVIGDGANDIDMFAITPNSFSFNHASENVKAHASYLVDTVAEALAKVEELNTRK
ncbi:HAD-IIB family hydrolase [Culicoidibacter larvae]|uniref:HAD-IIB family hydrolase n=1 Tax=Culicoidibacter larvae TaxID=2579976 RepID=A0A5R8QC92_9FIRM|nr:HAD-IIB family hydrolase [Culicoidibacter larvae]TLG74189.1 HAD-IIB family hydrolase [Culicoidibacter larvae]